MPPMVRPHAGTESGMIDVVRDLSANSGAGPISSRDPAAPARGVAARAAGKVAIVVYDGVGVFELGVACDVFGNTDLTNLGVPWYRLSICGAGGTTVTADGGLRIEPPYGLEKTRRVDTLIVPPTDRLDELPAEVFDALRRAHARGCRIISLVHRRVRPGRGGTAQGPAGHHALDRV